MRPNIHNLISMTIIVAVNAALLWVVFRTA
jgi:hypothetical protein